MKTKKKRWGDRADGTRVRDLDAMHIFMPYLLPNRADNEAFISENIDMTAAMEFLAQKNAENPVYKYTLFHLVTAALAKTIYQRPRLNRFITGRRLYQRNEILLSFVAKKIFSDAGEEALVQVRCDGDTTLSSLHETICRKVSKTREEGDVDDTTKIMNAVCRLPRFVLRFFIGILNLLEYFGHLPAFLREADPYHATVFISNLGSIKLNAAYHHLTNWGTNSIFVVVGEKHLGTIPDGYGGMKTAEVLPLGITLDERIADGYYYAKSVKLLKYLLENPELLEEKCSEGVEYESRKNENLRV